MAQLTAQQERLQDDLRGLIGGDVRCDGVVLQSYATDSSLFECRPLAVVFPKSKDDVISCVKYAAEHRIPLHPRGAGTGRAGGCLGSGIVLDFTRHMRRTLQVSDDSVLIQPGAVLERVNQQLGRSQERLIGPDPGYGPTTTVGSVLASDGAGAHWLKYGFPHQVVRKLQVVLANGELITLERRSHSQQQQQQQPQKQQQLRQSGQTAGQTSQTETNRQSQTLVSESALTDGESLSAFSTHLKRELANFLSLTSVSKTVTAQALLGDKPYRQGYRIGDVLQNGQVDLMSLLIGSEGTLGIITQAEIETTRKAKSTGIMLFLFDRLDYAMQAVWETLPYKPTLCELVDRRRINLLRDWDARYQSLVPSDAEAILVVEIDGDDPLSVGDRIHDLVNEVRYTKQLCFTARVALHENDLSLFRDFIAKSQFALYRMSHYLSGISRLEDVAVPVDQLANHLVAVQNIFKRHELTPSFFGHVGQGQISVQPVLNLSATDALQRIRRVIPEYYDEVLRCGGSIGSEQVFGWARSPFVSKQFNQCYHIYEQIKRLFDPHDLFNPGKIIARDDTPVKYRSQIVAARQTGGGDVSQKTGSQQTGLLQTGSQHNANDMYVTNANVFEMTLIENTDDSIKRRSTSNNRIEPYDRNDTKVAATNTVTSNTITTNAVTANTVPTSIVGSDNVVSESDLETGPDVVKPIRRQIELQLKWDPTSIRETTFRCNGCGRCRSRMPGTRMCPVFRHAPDEEVAPRAKANLMRGVIDGQEDLGILTSELSKTVADHCIHCHMCQRDCPTEVDMPKIAFQSKCAFTAAHGLSLSDRFLSHLDQVLKCINLVSCPVNWSISNRWMRWLYEKMLGISHGRKLPKLSKISFLSRTIWYKRLSKPSRRRDKKVALFIDTYSNYFDPRIADAAVKVLEHNGVDVYVPGRQLASGVLSIACGHYDRVEKFARHNVTLLSDVIRQGYHVVTLEPASAVCLKDEYGYIIDDADSALVKANTSDIATYLCQLHQSDQLQLDFSPIHTTVGYHAPCRALALGKQHLSQQTAAEQLLHLVPGLAVRRLEYGCCGLAGNFGLQTKTFRMSLRIGMPLFGALRDPAIKIGASECNFCKLQMEQGCNKTTLHPVVLLAHAYGFLPEIAPLLKTAR